MPQWFIDLLQSLGFNTVAIGGITVVALKFIFLPAYQNFLTYRNNQEQIKWKAKYDIEALQVQADHKQAELSSTAWYSSQEKYLTSKLELETIKVNRVIPHLEEINSQLSNHRIMFNTYLLRVSNRGVISKEFETARLELDTKLIESINKVSIFIPKEIRIILGYLRGIVSVSWEEPEKLYRIVTEDRLKMVEVTIAAQNMYKDYVECFYEMVYQYLSLSNEDVNYKEIMNKYSLAEDGNYIKDDFLTRYAQAFILWHEFTSTEQYQRLFNELEIRNNATM